MTFLILQVMFGELELLVRQAAVIYLKNMVSSDYSDLECSHEDEMYFKWSIRVSLHMIYLVLPAE